MDEQMSAEVFSESLQAISDRLAESVPKFASKEAAEAWYQANKAIETYEWAKAISIRDRAILEAAADRHCRKTCDERGYRDSEYHCRICPDRRAILEPITKEKS